MLDNSAEVSQDASLEYAIVISKHLSYLFWIIIGIVSSIYTAWTFLRQTRQVTSRSLTTKCQKWFSRATFGKRHAEAIKLSGLTVGTIPTGGQSILLMIYTIYIILASTLGYRTSSTYVTSPALQLCKYIALRTGIITLANLPLVVGLAGRNNIVALVTGVSKDSLNTLHRWSGRMVLVLSVTHTVCYLVSYGLLAREESYLSILQSAYSNAYFKAGIAALVGVIFLTTHSLRFLRELYYDLFRILHILGVLTFLVGTLLHAIYAESGGNVTFWLYIALGLFFLDHYVRLVQLIYVNCPSFSKASGLGTSICLSPVNSEITKVVISLPRHALINEGETIYLLIPRLSIYQWHPFTVISTKAEDYRRVRQSSCDTIVSTTSTAINEDCYDDEEKFNSEKTLVAMGSERSSAEFARPTNTPSTHHLQLRIKGRGAFSYAVHQLALSRPDLMNIKAFVQPVVQRSFINVQRYDSLVLVAGGIGITAILPVLRRAAAADLSKGPKRVNFIWLVKTCDEYANLANEIESLIPQPLGDAKMDARLRVFIYVTSGTRPWPLPSSSPIPIFFWRPDLDAVLAESTTTPGRTGIAVCGPPRLVDDIRSWITGPKCTIPIDYHDHSF